MKLALTAIALISAGLSGCAATPATMQPEPVSPDIALINAMPSTYTGRIASVTGRIQLIERPGVFVIRGQETSDEIVIVSDMPPGRLPPMKVGDFVRIHGRVDIFDADLAAGAAPVYGGTTQPLNPAFFEQWRNHPTIVADDIAVLGVPPTP